MQRRFKLSATVLRTKIGVVTESTFATKGIQDLLRKRGGFEVIPRQFSKLRTKEFSGIASVVIVQLSSGLLHRKGTLQMLSEISANSKAILLLDDAALTCLPALQKTGILGYALKTCSPGDLLDAITDVQLGRTHIDRSLREHKLLQELESIYLQRLQRLTKRELEILSSIGEGMSNKEIASHCHVSERTVENHRFSITKKLGVKSTAALVKLAVRHCLTCLD